ncbi:MAG: HNH endonuclease [Paracoccus hibiscisoli]|uniref:HNH endonuclease n=1 Tax=Paracoccus hibiscisoli TaxID=2023261 RepID=UPI00391DFB21
MRGTWALSAEEIGAYALILAAIQAAPDRRISADDARLARIARLSKRRWISAVWPALAEFFLVDDGAIRSILIEAETEQAKQSRSGIPSHISAAVWARDGQTCAYCGTTEGPFHLDHIVPWSRGGDHSEGNLTVACAPCNWSKGSKSLDEWRGLQ